MPVKLPPMPEAIAKLPRDNRGYPIPYIADWTSRRPTPEVKTDPRIGRVADCSCSIGEGDPILGEPCMKRAIECASQRLCSTCGQSLVWSQSYVWPSASGDRAALFIEPANHPDCLAWSLRVCPYLVAKGRAPGSLEVVSARTYNLRQIRQTRSATVVVASATPEAHREAPGYLYGYALVPFLLTTRTPADQWLSQRRFGT